MFELSAWDLIHCCVCIYMNNSACLWCVHRKLDDSLARREWGWRPKFTLDLMVDDILDYMIANYDDFKDVKLAPKPE